jgi:hypothetical protein
MHTGALKPAESRLISTIIIICLLLAATTVQAAGQRKKKNSAQAKQAIQAQSISPAKGSQRESASKMREEWGPYLDVAYELTYWSKAEIKEWREKSEKEIGQKLADFSTNLNLPVESTESISTDGKDPVNLENDYLRLALAKTIDYLQNDDKESLNGAEQLLDRLKDRTSIPKVAFWTGFVKALKAIENDDSVEFVSQVYYIWNNSVKYAELTRMAEKSVKGYASASLQGEEVPYFYRNIVNLVVQRAIIERKLGGLEALGPLFLMLKERDMEERSEEGKYLTTVVQRIFDGLKAPDSDRYRLNFTVALIEARRLRNVAEAKLVTEKMSERAKVAFEQSRLFYNYALKWASSRKSCGTASVMIDYLDISSFAIQRLFDKENLSAPAYPYFSILPGHDGASSLKEAMETFEDMAYYENEGWEKPGYENKESYISAMHRLWRATMELALWTGDFYLMKFDATTDKNFINPAASLQGTLNSYLDFFFRNAIKRYSETSMHYPDIVPDSACFGAAEAAEKLSYAYRKTDYHSTGVVDYNHWFLHRLQAAELFPFDIRAIAQTSSTLKRDGRYDLFFDYFLPLAERFKRSPAVKNWLEAHNSEPDVALIREYSSTIDEVFVTASNQDKLKSKSKGLPQFDATFKKLREELQRKPDHPMHTLLKAFYVEEMQNTTSYSLLVKEPGRLNKEQ